MSAPAFPPAPAESPLPPTTTRVGIPGPLAVGAGLATTAVVLGLAAAHTPAGYALILAGFPSALAAKSWLATAVALLVLAQVSTAAGMWGRLGTGAASWSAPVHRWAGRLAVAVSVPVAVHCVYAAGLSTASPRVVVHAVLAGAAYGAFVTKMLLLSRPSRAAWALPVLGGLFAATLIGVWLTSALWFFTSRS